MFLFFLLHSPFLYTSFCSRAAKNTNITILNFSLFFSVAFTVRQKVVGALKGAQRIYTLATNQYSYNIENQGFSHRAKMFKSYSGVKLINVVERSDFYELVARGYRELLYHPLRPPPIRFVFSFLFYSDFGYVFVAIVLI